MPSPCDGDKLEKVQGASRGTRLKGHRPGSMRPDAVGSRVSVHTKFHEAERGRQDSVPGSMSTS